MLTFAFIDDKNITKKGCQMPNIVNSGLFLAVFK